MCFCCVCKEVVKPLRELRGFEKVYLEAGERSTVTIDIPVDNLRYFINGRWQLEKGTYSFEICSDAGNVIISKLLTIDDGETVSVSGVYNELYSGDKEAFLKMTDAEFDKLIGRDISAPVVKTPYDLNTPMREYKTILGRALFELVALVFEFIYNYEMISNAPNKETRVKNAYFSWKTIKTMSLRSISFASEGLLSYKMANVLLAVANDDVVKAVKLLFESEKTLSLPQ